ncbi:MAG: hypothetical protein K2M54_05255 [Muribaculaceae bacterium]|nr:hypothetical protein [Muribaculaceae bacterium]
MAEGRVIRRQQRAVGRKPPAVPHEVDAAPGLQARLSRFVSGGVEAVDGLAGRWRVGDAESLRVAPVMADECVAAVERPHLDRSATALRSVEKVVGIGV